MRRTPILSMEGLCQKMFVMLSMAAQKGLSPENIGITTKQAPTYVLLAMRLYLKVPQNMIQAQAGQAFMTF